MTGLTTPADPSSSLKQNPNKSLTLTDKPFDIEVLARLFASHGGLGRVLRTLAYYAQVPQPPQRPQDIETLLFVSAALARSRRRP